MGAAVVGYRALHAEPQLAAKLGYAVRSVVGSWSGGMREAPGVLQDIKHMAALADHAPTSALQAAVNRVAESRAVHPMGEGAFRGATLADYLHQGTKIQAHMAPSMARPLKGYGQEDIAQAVERLRSSGVDVQHLKKISIGRGLLMKDDQLVDLGGFLPGTIFRKAAQLAERIRVPFTQFRPADIFQAKAALHGRQFSPITKELSPTGRPALFAAGKLIDEQTGKELSGDYHLYTEHSRLGRSHEIATGRRQAERRDPHDFLRSDSGLGPFQRWLLERMIGKGEWKANEHDQWEKKVEQSTLGRLFGQHRMENFPIGPHLAEDESGVHGVGDWIKRITVGRPVARHHVEHAPSWNELSFFDKVRLKLGVETEHYRFEDPRGRTIGRRMRPSHSVAGHEQFVEDVHRAADKSETNNLTGGKMVPVAKGRQTAETWAHLFTDRPNRLLESTTGWGVAPARTALGNLATTAVVVGGGAWAAWNLAGYINNAAFHAPSKAAAVALGSAEVAKQAALNASGISEFAQGSEDLLPGSVDSAAGQVARLAGLPLLGMAVGGMLMGRTPAGKKAIEQELKAGTEQLVASLTRGSASTAKAEARGKLSGAIVAELEIMSPAQQGRLIGFGAGAMLGLLTVLGDPKADVGQVYRQQTGEERVPVRESRWWVMGRCLAESCGVAVDMLGTIVRARDIVIGDHVVNKDGRITTVEEVFVRDVQSDESVYEFESSADHGRPVTLSDNHPVLCIRSKTCRHNCGELCRPDRDWTVCRKHSCTPDMNQGWTEAEQLAVGDYVAQPIVEFGTESSIDGRELDANSAWLVGHYLAEGNVHRRNNGKVYSIQLTADLAEHDEIARRLALVPDVSVTMRKNSEHALVVHGVAWCDWLVSAVGSADKKKFPENFFMLRKDLALEVLRGYFYGDGHFENKGRGYFSGLGVSCCTRRDGLLYTFQRALLAFGVTSSIARGVSRYKGQDFYKSKLLMSVNGLSLFSKHYADRPSSSARSVKSRTSFIKDGLAFYRIISKKKIEYSGKLYDFRVNESSSFCTSSFIVHNSPFEGGKIKYFEPSAAQKLWHQEARDLTLYGGTDEYYKHGTLFPTPHNWFGLRPIISPYEVENRAAMAMPYPETSGRFGNVPIFGHVLEPTVGQVLKPHVGRELPEREGRGGGSDGLYAPVNWGFDQRGLQPGMGAQLGLPDAQLNQPSPASADSLRQIAGRVQHSMQEYSGAPGFLFGAFVQQPLTGRQDVGANFQLASSGQMQDVGAWFKEQNLGGLFGMTEYPRRLMQAPQTDVDLYNPLPNTMPRWLPGSDSEFDQDRAGGIDFSTGNAYCVALDSIVETEHGVIVASDVARGYKIVTHTGRSLNVSAIKIRPIEDGEKCFSVRVATMSALPLRLSEEHPIYVRQSSKRKQASGNEWRQAQDVKVGDYAAYPMPVVEDRRLTIDLLDTGLTCTQKFAYADWSIGEATAYEYIEATYPKSNVANSSRTHARGELDPKLAEWNISRQRFENLRQLHRKGGHVKRAERHVEVDDSIAYLLGIYCAEGSIGRSLVSFALHARELEIVSSIRRALLRFGCGVSVHIIDGTNGISVNSTGNTAILSLFLKHMCGSGFATKHVPTNILSSRVSTVGFLRGLIDGDGCYFETSRRVVNLHMANLGLVYMCRKLALGLGIVGSLARIPPRDGSKESFSLCFNGNECEKMAVLLGYKDGEVAAQVSTHHFVQDGYVYMRIEEVLEIELDEVIGYQIDGDESFCVAGVATHNTKIEHGYTRLPGPGYEEMYGELHGKGEYDTMDLYRVLSDVAPGSQAHRFYAKQARHMYDKGQLDATWSRRFEQTERETEQRLGHYQFQDSGRGVMSEHVGDMLGYANANVKERANANGLLAPVSNIWDQVTHTRVPGWAWAQGKLMHNRTPLEEYQASRVYGEEFADWSDPYKGFVRPAMTELAGAMNGTVPEYRKREWETQEYFDKLKYMKARRLESMAELQGQSKMAANFRTMASETMVGLPTATPQEFNEHVFQATPKPDRPFLPAFAQANAGEASKIYQTLPDYQKGVMLDVWQKNGELPGELQEAYAERHRQGDDRARADAETAQFFARHALPADDWQGWHPDVNLEELKYKSAAVEGLSYANLGISQRESRQYDRQRQLYAVDTSTVYEDAAVANNLRAELTRYNLKPNLSPTYGAQTMVLTQDNRAREQQAVGRQRERRFA